MTEATPPKRKAPPPPRIIFFSSKSENTARFVGKLSIPAERIPLSAREPMLEATYPYILVTPTYGAGRVEGSVPPAVNRFLAFGSNARNCCGVIVGGNTTFGVGYCSAGTLIAQAIHVPVLYRFEVLGTPADVAAVEEGITQKWKQLMRMRMKSRDLL